MGTRVVHVSGCCQRVEPKNTSSTRATILWKMNTETVSNTGIHYGYASLF